MPRISHSPETPVPVPISTTARASIRAASIRRAAPPPEPIATHADLLGAGAGGGEDLVLADVVLGVGPGGGLGRLHEPTVSLRRPGSGDLGRVFRAGTGPGSPPMRAAREHSGTPPRCQGQNPFTGFFQQRHLA